LKSGCILGHSKGFTLVELMVTISIIGILVGLAVPIANSYRLRAEYAQLQSALKYLMDGQEAYFLEADSFYPESFGILRIHSGEAVSIPELKYNFPAGHKHSYDLYGINLDLGKTRINYYYIYVYADFDLDQNGRNDLFVAMTCLRDYEPLSVGGKQYYRPVQQMW